MIEQQQFSELPGVSEATVAGVIVNMDADSVIAALDDHRAVSAAADGGCVMAWVDDHGLYRADLQRYCNTVSSASAESADGLRPWLETIIPQV